MIALRNAEDVAGGGVDKGRHPRLHPPPAVLVAEPTNPAVAVLIDPEPAHVQLVHVREQHGRGVHRGCTVHHATPWAAATSATARPEPIAASSTAVRSRVVHLALAGSRVVRSEEHTSELQSRGHLVCRLLL